MSKSDKPDDAEKDKPLPERFDALMKRLMGYSRPKDPRKEEEPLFATFQDRAIASVFDTAIIYILFNDIFAFISSRVFRYADIKALKQANEQAPRDASSEAQARYFVETMFETGLADLWLLNSFLQSLFVGLVLIFVWSNFHITPGKFIFGLEFAGKDGTGKPTTEQYIWRYAGFYLSMPPFMIGFLALAFDKKKRAWHDRIGNTTVIYSRRGSVFRMGWDWLKARFGR